MGFIASLTSHVVGRYFIVFYAEGLVVQPSVRGRNGNRVKGSSRE